MTFDIQENKRKQMLQIAATNIFAIKTFVFLTQIEVLCIV